MWGRRLRLAGVWSGIVVGTMAQPGTSSAQAEPDASLCAGAATSCDGSQTQCCAWWSVDVDLDGSAYGAVTEDSYSKLMTSVENERRTDERLCRFFGDHESCATTYGAPHCADAVSGVVSPVVPAALDAAASTAVSVTREMNKTADSVFAVYEHIERFRPFITGKAAGTVESVRERFAAMHATLNDYLGSLNDALRRVRDLRNQQDRCSLYYNPYLQMADNATDPWSVGGMFGGHVESAHRSAAAQTGARSVLRFTSRTPPPPIAVTIEGPTAVLRVNGRGAGRLLFGTAGSLEAQGQLSGGNYSVLYAAPKANGSLDLVTPIVAVADRPDGRRLTITATSVSGNEAVVLLSCTGGRVIAGARCVCPPGSFFQDSTCVVPRPVMVPAPPVWSPPQPQAVAVQPPAVAAQTSGYPCYCEGAGTAGVPHILPSAQVMNAARSCYQSRKPPQPPASTMGYPPWNAWMQETGRLADSCINSSGGHQLTPAEGNIHSCADGGCDNEW